MVMNYTLTVTSDTQTYKNHYMYPSNDTESSLVYGFAPETIAESFDQRLRWVKGSIQLIMNNNPLICSKKLKFLQRISYFQSNFYWVFGIMFFLQIISHIIWLSSYINNPVTSTESLSDLITYLFSYSSHFIFFLLIPGVSIGSKIGAMIMFITYTPVYIYAFLSYLVPSIFTTSRSSNKSKQIIWHFLFLFHIIVLVLIWILVSIGLSFGDLNNWQIANIISMAMFYTIGFLPVLFGLVKGIFGNNYHVKNPRCTFNLKDIGYN
jgi:cellulose synthase/poly-beta-1,6-N-acetylglucosamine synthase-like glycosyltransferase